MYIHVSLLSMYSVAELMQCCNNMQVVGIDVCGRFIDAAMKIQGGKVLQCGPQQVAKLPSQADPSRVQFKQVQYMYMYMYVLYT